RSPRGPLALPEARSQGHEGTLRPTAVLEEAVSSLPSKPVSFPPTFATRTTSAWRIDMAALRQRLAAVVSEQQKADDGGVDAWLIEAPWAHSLWHSYFLGLVHLRELPGQSRPPRIYRAGATHELMLYALAPEADRDVVILRGPGNWLLWPANYAGQFVAES